ncbi:MAG TPA: YetF domain-containing protein [Pyrinomonadaceae bacterium]
MEALQNFFLLILGPDGRATELTFLQISLRGFVIFIAGLARVRIGDRRSLAEKTAFDAIFIVLLGSMLSRAINGTAPFFATIAAGAALMLIHRLFAFASFHSHWFGKIVKGTDVVVVRDGKIDRENLRRCLVSVHDLEEDLRLDAKTEDLTTIQTARIERSGDISFVKKEA